MCHGGMGKLTKLEDAKRIEKGEIKLFLTTSVLLCGVDLPRVDIVVIARPFSHISSILQAAGRGGRIQQDGTRRRVAVYLCYNATDIRVSATHIRNDVKKLYSSNACVKEILFNHFSSISDKLTFEVGSWCCNLHFS